MGSDFKKHVFLITTHLLIGFLGYRFKQVSNSVFVQQWTNSQFSFGFSEQNELENSSTMFPFSYDENLPTTKRDIHSPLYLIQLAKLEGFIFSLLSEVEELDSVYLHPKLLQKIQTYDI